MTLAVSKALEDGSQAVVCASTGNTSLCKGAVKLLTNSGTNLSYVWNWNGQAIPLSNLVSYTPKVAGKYTVTITQGKFSSTSPAIIVENAGFGAQNSAPIARRVFDFGLLNQYPSVEDIAAVQKAQAPAPIGKPRTVAELPWPPGAPVVVPLPASAASAVAVTRR